LQKLYSLPKSQADYSQTVFNAALRYNGANYKAEALKIHQYNAEHPTGTMHSMWSQEALAYNCIDTGDDSGLEAAFNNHITTYSKRPTLPKEIFQLGGKYVVQEAR
jgi:hypothetical protein